MENDPQALAELEGLGLRNVPVTMVGNKVVVGFNREELARLFSLRDAREKRVADSRFFETFDKILEAVIRAALQVPASHLMWRSPDRDRPLKVFCYHILADPHHVLDAISTQRYDGSFKLTYGEASERFRTMEEVGRFGQQARTRLREASESLTAAELERSIEGYAGQTNGHELLYQVLSHTAHHLRQLYDLLRRIGVVPNDPLQEKDFEGISMPKELW